MSFIELNPGIFVHAADISAVIDGDGFFSSTKVTLTNGNEFRTMYRAKELLDLVESLDGEPADDEA